MSRFRELLALIDDIVEEIELKDIYEAIDRIKMLDVKNCNLNTWNDNWEEIKNGRYSNTNNK